jgi:hypothetical protein
MPNIPAGSNTLLRPTPCPRDTTFNLAFSDRSRGPESMKNVDLKGYDSE